MYSRSRCDVMWCDVVMWCVTLLAWIDEDSVCSWPPNLLPQQKEEQKKKGGKKWCITPSLSLLYWVILTHARTNHRSVDDGNKSNRVCVTRCQVILDPFVSTLSSYYCTSTWTYFELVPNPSLYFKNNWHTVKHCNRNITLHWIIVKSQ